MENIKALPVRGIRLGTAQAGIRKQGRDDLLLMALAPDSTIAAVFTQNAFCAAPVVVARELLASQEKITGLLVNSGNANAGTGASGEAAAWACVQAAGKLLGSGSVLPFSTGVIGEPLPVDKLTAALPQAIQALQEGSWPAAARAIMTTDTVPKAVSRQLEIDGQTVTLTGIAKGAGMIRPDMATMLAFIACDADVRRGDLQDCLNAAVHASFNCITVDGDTSTNDACVLIASGEGPKISSEHAQWGRFAEAVTALCVELAQAIVRDGEGATRLITLQVVEASDVHEARAVADTVAHSPLVKTACFAGDPNWGRILAAVGRSPVTALDVSAVQIWLDDVQVLRDGALSPDYTEAAGAAVMAKTEYCIRIALGRGGAQARVWTCDFSYDYVKINAEYRS